MKIFGVLFPDGFDYDAGFIANLDKSKESDGKFFFENWKNDSFEKLRVVAPVWSFDIS